MMNHDRKGPVTLEDILRLKRAERPPAEFWNQFDRELRAKQLAALVEKRPWWRTVSLARVLGGVRRYHLPLGATAVLAVTILSVREYRAPKSAAVSAALPAHAATAPATLASLTAPAAVASESVRVEPPAPSLIATAEASPASSDLVLSSEATPSGNLAQMISLVGTASGADESTTTLSPGARLMTEDFAALQPSGPALSRQLLSPPRGFETRVLPARTKPVEPLALMKVPAGSRRSNLIASATLASTTTPVLTSERSARGLSDERLYESISRINARGAGMLVKF